MLETLTPGEPQFLDIQAALDQSPRKARKPASRSYARPASGHSSGRFEGRVSSGRFRNTRPAFWPLPPWVQRVRL